jgi:glycosyltransferase involved in cell wall biosynthesis
LGLGRPSAEDPKAARLLRGRRNLFYLGQVSRHKGVDLLLESFRSVAAAHPDVMLHLVGGIASGFELELDRLTSQPGLAGRVKCWGFRGDALHLLRYAYLHVHPAPPSRFHESFGRGVVEAMALSVPTVCFRSGALQEIVVHEQTGLLCEESVALLSSALHRFLSAPGFRDACATEARNRFLRTYSPEVTREQWRRVFFLPEKPAAALASAGGAGGIAV